LATLVAGRQRVALYFTWFFQGGTAVFFLFLVYIVYRFGHVHLGRRQPKPRVALDQHNESSRSLLETSSHESENPDDDIDDVEAPEFSTLSYVCMILACGLGAGFFGSTVSQPLASRVGHFYAAGGYRSQDELDFMAITLSMTTSGFSVWSTYCMVAVNMCLAVHCFQLPVALRSCFFPIFGHYTWGWMGDLIDSVAIVTTISGLCTSLALSSIRIVRGLVVLGIVDDNAPEGHISAIQNTTIWIITIAATASVLSGLHGGVRILSGWAAVLSSLLLLLVLVMEDTKFILNLMIQETGHYLQNYFLLNFWTDAFGQLAEGSGRAVDGKSSELWWME
jgi:choline-glycine betaine transporter